MKLHKYILLGMLLLGLCPRAKAQHTVIDTVCNTGQKRVYRVNPTPGSIYVWNVQCGSIQSDNQYADSIVVVWCLIPGVYDISVVERNKNGCWGDTVKNSVVVTGPMNLQVYGPADLCQPVKPVWMQATGALKYKWSNGATTSQIEVNPQDSVNPYYVIGRNGCETDTAYLTVRVHPKPLAAFTYKPQQPMVNEDVYFHYAGKGATDWVWYLGDKNALGGAIPDPVTSFSEKGEKTVTLIARNQFGCSDTVSYLLHVGYESKIFVPNAFTPDGNGDNDSFRAVGFNIKTIHTMIFNRWGEKLYDAQGLYNAWDGTFKGQLVMEGVYIYQIDAEATDGEHYYLHGNVTVIY